MAQPRYDLTAEQAVQALRAEAAKHRNEPRGQLAHLSPDDAWDEGYAACLRDLESLTGPDPKVEFNDAAGRLARGEKP